MMGLWKIVCCSAIILTFSLTSVHGQDQRLSVIYDGEGHLSVAVENAELKEVLTAVGEKTGISIRSPENLKRSITVQFDRVPLEEGLHRILRDVNHVLIFSQSDEKNEPETVTGVFIPSEEAKGSSTRWVSPSVPVQSRVEPEKEIPENEEMTPGAMERDEEEGEDPILARYERQLDQLEEQLDTVGEDTPQGRAIMSRIARLRKQMEKRLEELDEEESQ